MKYIDADKLLDIIIIKMQKEYATQEVTEDHKGLRAVLGGQCLVLTEIIEIIDSLQQDQPEVDLDEAAMAIVLKKHPIMEEAFTMEMAVYEMVELVKEGYKLGLNARKEE